MEQVQKLADTARASPAAAIVATVVATAAACAGLHAYLHPVHPNLVKMRGRMGKAMGSLHEAHKALTPPQDREAFVLAGTDVVVAVPGKSGTTWLMHIAHQVQHPDYLPRFTAYCVC